MGKIIVRPSDECIKENRVALWDQDLIHADCDPRWQEISGFGGAYIAGDSRKPEATYVVVATMEVNAALRSGRLVKVSDVDEAPAEPVEPAKPDGGETVTPPDPDAKRKK